MSQTTSPSAQQVLLALRDARTKLEAAEARQHEPIAIIGMSCRLPGANTPAEFWQLLHNGQDLISEIPSDRWDVDAFYQADSDDPSKMYTRQMGAIHPVDRFDPHFFGISPREAKYMDPQQRLLLELCWEALEAANQLPDSLRLSQTGVFMGICSTDYHFLCQNDEAANADYNSVLGNLNSVAAGRTAPKCVRIETTMMQTVSETRKAISAMLMPIMGTSAMVQTIASTTPHSITL